MSEEKKNFAEATELDPRERDEYNMFARSEQELIEEVSKMEDNSRWIPSIRSKEIKVCPIPDSLHVPEISAETKLPANVLSDTANSAALYVALPDGSYRCIRDISKWTLFERASIEGAALGREAPGALSETLNLALNVSKGDSLLLMRYGKIAAFHSDSAYRIIPISELLKITIEELNKHFGTPVFMEGFNSHSFTKAIWQMPDVKDDLCAAYEQILRKSASSARWDFSEMVPAVRLTSSDTATSAVCLQPLFMTERGAFIHIVDGLRVKHIRAGGSKKDGLELFEDLVTTELFTKFTSGAEKMEELGNIDIWHAENVVVGLANKFRIPKKYADPARETVLQFMNSTSCLTALDVFLVMSEALSNALSNGMKESTYLTMDEKLYSTLSPNFDWRALDVGGVVAWGPATQS